MVKVRFAPSPTGKIHIGNGRIAVLNWLFAKSQNGHFLLRSDDTDTMRSTKEFEDGIINDMKWLGLTHDSYAKQSDNIARYDAVLEHLKSIGRVYACYETGEELTLKRNLQQAQGKPPVYDRESLRLTDEQKAEKEAQNIQPYWRFLLNDDVIEWQDMSRGHTRFEPGHLSDPVLVRADGRYLYTLSSVVDDIDMDITHIMRGEDHTTNTATQVQLFEALKAPVPTFAHMALITGKDGEGLSKRTGSGSIEELRTSGLESITVVSALAKLGSSFMADGTDTLETLVKDFDIGAFSRNSPKFDTDDLFGLNSKVIHNLSYDAVKGVLDPSVSQEIWTVISGNIDKLSDATDWVEILSGDIAPVIDDAEFIASALSLLPTGDITADTWKAWTTTIKETTGKKGKELFMPLRLALTGQAHGPEMGKVLPVIGYEKIQKRLG